jgi:hypothetical protein
MKHLKVIFPNGKLEHRPNPLAANTLAYYRTTKVAKKMFLTIGLGRKEGATTFSRMGLVRTTFTLLKEGQQVNPDSKSTLNVIKLLQS